MHNLLNILDYTGGDIMKVHTVAAIDIGSSAIRMKIAELKENGKIEVIEDIRHNSNLGRDTFSSGMISAESVNNVCDVLNRFKRILKEYKIKKHRVVATTALREAGNREYVIDRIYISTGFKVQVISTTEEKLLTYTAIKQKLKEYEAYKKEGMAVVDLGSGGFELSIYNRGQFKFTNYIKLGSQRLRELLSDLENKNLDYAKLMDEYVEGNIYMLKPMFLEYPINRLIILGGEIKTIARLCKARELKEDIKIITKEAFERIYRDITKIDNSQSVLDYSLDKDRIEGLIPSLIVFRKFLEFTNADEIIAPLISLRDGVIADLGDMLLYTEKKEIVIRSMLELAKNTAERYHFDENHSLRVAKLALEIFNGTKDIHGLKDTHRILLHLSAILHDIGKYIQLRDHHSHSYYIVKWTDFIGVTDEQKEIIANIVKYHSDYTPHRLDREYIDLEPKDRIIVFKLSAILRLADALDITHKQKIDSIKIERKDGSLLFKAVGNVDCNLEKWSFDKKAQFFEEVFGLSPSLTIKER